VVERDDRPGVRVVPQDAFEPGDLLLLAFVGVERDDAYALVIDVVGGLLQPVGAVLGEGELGGPVPRELGLRGPLGLGLGGGAGIGAGGCRGGRRPFVLVVAGRGDAGDHRVDPPAGPEPLAPLGVAVGVVHQVAGVDDEPRLGGVGIGAADDPGP